MGSEAGGGGPVDFVRAKIRDDLAAGRFDRVQTRFPPEPNGYLHIGHAKAVALNHALAREFDGEFNLRFDDTNPETEETEYAAAIEADLAWLGCPPPGPAKYASDYFEQIYAWAEHLIERGVAYVDDQDHDTISAQRGGYGRPGIESPFRNRPVVENLDLFRRMRAGEFADGARVLRAKIDMQHENMQLRDPVLYRIRRATHLRTGNDWVIYPTYDWAHGQSDAIEGVTHSLCTLEFSDHRPLYDWFLDQLPLPRDRPEQTEFARLELTHTVTSKRKLRELVTDGQLDGWDDPRMPTLRGLRRRGYPPEAILAFVDHIGVARTNSVVEIELLESFVRTALNRAALRRMAVLRPLKLTITNWAEGDGVTVEAINNPEDLTAGTRRVPFGADLWIEADDFMLEPAPKYYRLAPGREVRLRAGYYVTATDVATDSAGAVTEVFCTYDPASAGGSTPDGRKVRSTIHWVSAATAIGGTVHLYDRLFTDPWPGADGRDPLESLNPASRETLTGVRLEPILAEVTPGEVVQFERLGYFAADLDDPTVFHRTVGLRDEWANIQKRQAGSSPGGRRRGAAEHVER
ncbi:glutamine--tRNA ligase/YqeY domain fusion protein [Skermania piniformis]|uniref:Glutamine--tRNA ligase n=1 Tax=Skermania pinensis TaxID=39122 RepID=A0ABX8SAV0_9ACTN|nr:glutamine--tRNA ligase/YqeY domain fusion protein [Skermania piniformis]QXQ14576.1 glutamine--tRNA ligase/YqeY domain fusion protein [Skermania piniformis]